MESGGMTSLSKQLDVKKLDDIIALIALYRPGPMELIPEYVKAKKGITPIKYLHPLLEDIRSEEHTSELQSQSNLVCRLLLEKKRTTHARSSDQSGRTNHIPTHTL